MQPFAPYLGFGFALGPVTAVGLASHPTALTKGLLCAGAETQHGIPPGLSPRGVHVLLGPQSPAPTGPGSPGGAQLQSREPDTPRHRGPGPRERPVLFPLCLSGGSDPSLP